MATIICDTNVWYNIANCNFDKSNWDGHQLVGTYNSLDELMRSDKYLDQSKLPNIRKALLACGGNHSFIYPWNPYVYALKLDNPDFKVDLPFDKALLEFTELYGNGKISDADAHDTMKDWVQQRMIELEEVAGHWQKLIDGYENQNPPQRHYTNLIPESKVLFNGLIEGWTKVHLRKKISLSKNFPWVKIDLFLHVLAGYLRELVFTQRKVAKNDLYDLFNIVYVKPGELYWTEEKFWKNLIVNQINYSCYSFSPKK